MIEGAISDSTTSSPGVEELFLPSGGVRVLQVLPTLEVSGVSRGALDVALALEIAGGKSLVASAGGPLGYELKKAGISHVNLPLDSKNPFTIHRNAGLLTSLIYDNKIDIIHARSRAPAWSAMFAAQRTGKHFVTTFHGTYNGSRGAKKLYNSVMARGEKVIAISDFIAQHVRGVYRVEPSRLVTVPRGIDTTYFDSSNVSAERVMQLAQGWRLLDGAPVVLLPGRLTRWKGQSVLIKALAKLGRTDLNCVLVGSDQGREHYRRELLALTESLGLGRIVRIVGHCSDMPAAYMLADVVVSASTDPEAFGRVTAEAQAMGRPVVATEHGGSRETIVNGKTGWLTPPGDPEALAAAISGALSINISSRKSLADRARRHITQNLTVSLMCKRTLAVYGRVLS